MRLRRSHPRRRAVVLFAWLVVSVATIRAQPTPPPAPPPTDRQIGNALAAVQADPSLATTRTIKTLRWKGRSSSRAGVPAWARWIAGFARWLDQSARLLVWVVVAVLISLLAVFIVRLLRDSEAADEAQHRLTPTHVQDLDIRPETLPADVGASARSLWDGGHHRAALALLYRGLLSRLAHVHHMPIRDSSTEGECLAFARTQLPSTRHEYVSRLIGVWQRAVYGHEQTEDATVYALCDGFIAALDPIVVESTR